MAWCLLHKDENMVCEQRVSRVLFRRSVTLPPAMAIHLGDGLLRRSSDTTRGTRTGRSRAYVCPHFRSCSRWGLPTPYVTIGVREILPHAFTLTSSELSSGRRFTFCGTFPEVTLAGRYPAPLPCGARTFLPLSNPKRLQAGDHPVYSHTMLARPLRAP
jgi:hypothetical protein